MPNSPYPPGRTRATLCPASTTIEFFVDVPEAPAFGCVLIAHPHPLLGGSASHPVPYEIATAAIAQNWIAVRPNFRGVGGSEGEHTQGTLETEDLLHVVAHIHEAMPSAPLVLIGFSFGAYVSARASEQLRNEGRAEDALLLISMPDGPVESLRHYATPLVAANTAILHGSRDTTVPLAQVLDYAERAGCLVTVFPGADHLFNRKRHGLGRFVGAWLAGISGRLGTPPAYRP